MRNIIYSALRSPDICKKYSIVIVVDEEYSQIFDSFRSEAKIIIVSNRNKLKKFVLRVFHYIIADVIYNRGYNAKDLFHLLDKKTIVWIPDFQEIYYPHFFSKTDIDNRIEWNSKVAKSKSKLILSSNACKQDFLNHYDLNSKKRVYVVHFVSAVEEEVRAIQQNGTDQVLKKYDLQKPYIFIANQFWQHKNHLVIFEMLAEAKKKNALQNVKFVFTGHLEDHRNPEYYQTLKSIIDENALGDKIKILGFIPRYDQLAIMSRAEFLIQPSLFEGWGTVVEDGKVLDKTILLSNILVHREQMNDKCVLFEPNSPSELLKNVKELLRKSIQDNIDNGIENLHRDANRYSIQLQEVLLK